MEVTNATARGRGDQTNDAAFEKDRRGLCRKRREKGKGSRGEKREMKAPFSRGPLALFGSSAGCCRRNPLDKRNVFKITYTYMHGLWMMEFLVVLIS